MKERKTVDLELSRKLDKMQYNGVSYQTKLVILFNQIVVFWFSDKEETVDLIFFSKTFGMMQQWEFIKLCSSVKIVLVGKELIGEVQEVMLKD